MSRGRIRPENKEEIGISAHYIVTVCTWVNHDDSSVHRVLCRLDPVDLRVEHEFISLEASRQNNDICGYETISSDYIIWCDLKSPGVIEKQLFVVQGFEISTVKNPSLSTTSLVCKVLNLKMDDHLSYVATNI